MNLVPSSVGANRKNIAILGGLVVVLAAVFIINRTPSAPGGQTPDVPSSSAAQVQTRAVPLDPVAISTVAPRTPSPTPMPAQRAAPGRPADRFGAERSIQDFKPSLKPPEGTDVSRIDPTLRLDLLAKLQEVPMQGGTRSLFEFAPAPAPKAAPPAVEPIKPLTPPPPSNPVASAAAKPPAPPIPLKFYGYVGGAHGATRRAFFLEGDDIFVAGEGDTVHNRYKIVRIGINSAVVEDTTNKNQQTLPLVAELAS